MGVSVGTLDKLDFDGSVLKGYSHEVAITVSYCYISLTTSSFNLVAYRN